MNAVPALVRFAVRLVALQSRTLKRSMVILLRRLVGRPPPHTRNRNGGGEPHPPLSTCPRAHLQRRLTRGSGQASDFGRLLRLV